MYSGVRETIAEWCAGLLRVPRIDCKSFYLAGRICLFKLLVVITPAPFGVSSSSNNDPSILPSSKWQSSTPRTQASVKAVYCIFCVDGKSGPFPSHLEILSVVISEESVLSKFGNGKVSSTINFFARSLGATSKATWIGSKIHRRPFSPNEKGGMIVSIRVSNVLYKSFKVNYCKHFR